MALRHWIVFPDIHCDYHDPRYIHLLKKVIKIVKPYGVAQLGDFADCWQISNYDRNPARKNTVYDDLMVYSGILDQITAVMQPGTHFYQLEGNHEDRLRRYTWGKAPELSQMVRPMADILAFQDRNRDGRVHFKWFPIAQWDACKIGDAVLHHGHYFNQHVAVGNLSRYPCKLITGHTHRFQYASNGKYWSVSLGHGAREDLIMHTPVPSNWQKCMGILTVLDGVCSFEPILVYDDICVLRGEVIK